MSGWNGFTDEDLNRLTGDKEATRKPNRKAAAQNSTVELRTSQLGGKKQKPKERLVTLSQKKPSSSSTESRPTQSESATAQPNAAFKTDQVTDKSATEVRSVAVDNAAQATERNKNDNSTPKRNSKDMSEPQKLPEIISDERAAELELSALEVLQMKQKKIEQENKKKKLLIKETIQQRYRKAQAETSVLQSVQKELSKLDQKLAGDVEMLRVRIEEASINFHHAEKRYEKAETEYVAAKIDVNQKREIKDDLTHHLCTIIQENEERKSRKLQEIMDKLQVQQQCVVDEVIPSSVVVAPESDVRQATETVKQPECVVSDSTKISTAVSPNPNVVEPESPGVRHGVVTVKQPGSVVHDETKTSIIADQPKRAADTAATIVEES